MSRVELIRGTFDYEFFLNLETLGVKQIHVDIKALLQLQEEWKRIYVPSAADGLPRDWLGEVCGVKVYLDS